MSYEGYRRFFCDRGHETIVGCYDDTPSVCTWCGEEFTCFNSVNQTNGTTDEDGTRIDGYVELSEGVSDRFPCRVCNGTGSQVVRRYDITNNQLINIRKSKQ
jgi:hypothetical protein